MSVDAIHNHFGLTYAQYIVLPRTALQSMPDEWQSQFVALIEKLNETFAYLPHETIPAGRDLDMQYRVTIDRLREVPDEDNPGQFVSQWRNDDIEDPLADYQRGRRRLKPRQPVVDSNKEPPCESCCGHC